MAICFDSIEFSSGLSENRFNVSKFIVHFDTLDLFCGRSNNDSIESKHVAISIFCVINCCLTEIINK